MATDPAALVRVVPALFLGLFLGVALAPAAARRLSLDAAVAGGAVLQALALVLLAGATTTPVAIAAASAAGVGFGLVESLGAALTRLGATARTGRWLTHLTAVTAAVATLAPLAVLAGGADSARLVVALAAVPHLLAAALIGRSGTPDAADTTTPSVGRPPSRRWLAGALFCYVGSETTVSGWSAVLPQMQLDLTATAAAAGTSVFWLLLTLGRLTGAALLARRADPHTVLVTVQVVGVALLAGSAALAGVPVWSVALLGAAVLCMGPCYAILLGVALQAVGPDDAPRTSAFLVAAGALGGAAWSAGIAAGGLDSRWIIATAGLALLLSTGCAHRAGRSGTRTVSR